jgi:hypothetical protein
MLSIANGASKVEVSGSVRLPSKRSTILDWVEAEGSIDSTSRGAIGVNKHHQAVHPGPCELDGITHVDSDVVGSHGDLPTHRVHLCGGENRY